MYSKTQIERRMSGVPVCEEDGLSSMVNQNGRALLQRRRIKKTTRSVSSSSLLKLIYEQKYSD